MSKERPSTIIGKGFEKTAELGQKLDAVVFLGGGGLILLGYPGVGWLIVAGNAITYVGAEGIKKVARKYM